MAKSKSWFKKYGIRSALSLVRDLGSSALALAVLCLKFLALTWKGYCYRLALAVVKLFLKVVQSLRRWENLLVMRTGKPQ